MVPPELETVTVIVDDEVPTFPAASKALETMVCDPFATGVVFQLKESDVAFVFEAATAPSIRICIWVTLTLSEAVAVIVTVPDTVAPLAGAVMEVVGGVVSLHPLRRSVLADHQIDGFDEQLGDFLLLRLPLPVADQVRRPIA